MAKRIEPNHELILKAKINVAKNAYEEYKKARHVLIDSTWIGDDGTFWMHGLEVANAKVEATSKMFEDAFNEVLEYKKLVESEKGENE